MKKLCLLFAVTGLMLGCNNVRKEVVATYEDNEPKVIQYLKKEDGKDVRVKEEMFYENGQYRYKGHFEGGKPSGEWQYFFDDGSTFAKATFTANDEKGTSWEFFTRSGKPLFESKGTLQVLQKDTSNCPVLVINATKDTAFQMEFYEKFDLKLSGTLVNGKQNGKWSCWFESGNLQTEGDFVNGLLEGTQKVYYENGSVYYSGQYKSGKRIGKWKFYNMDGDIVNEQDYGEGTAPVI